MYILYIPGGAKAGLQLRVHETVYSCVIIFHMNNCKPALLYPVISTGSGV